MSKYRKREEKLLKQQDFLQKIFERKDDLFGQFSATVTKTTKKTAWSEIRDYAVSIGLITTDKDYTYVRDAAWPNLRSRTMTKIKAKKSEGSISHLNLDEADKLVLEITGESAIVGYDPQDPELSDSNDNLFIVTDSNDGNHEDEEGEGKAANPINTKTRTKNISRKRTLVHEKSTSAEEIKKQILQLQARRLQLEIWEKERLLGVVHCPLTCNTVSILENGWNTRSRRRTSSEDVKANENNGNAVKEVSKLDDNETVTKDEPKVE